MSLFILGQFLKAISISSSLMGLAASLFCYPVIFFFSMFLLIAAHCSTDVPKVALNPPAIFLQLFFFFLVYWSAIQLLLFSTCRSSDFYAAFSLPFILIFLSGLLFSKYMTNLHFFVIIGGLELFYTNSVFFHLLGSLVSNLNGTVRLLCLWIYSQHATSKYRNKNWIKQEKKNFQFLAEDLGNINATNETFF